MDQHWCSSDPDPGIKSFTKVLTRRSHIQMGRHILKSEGGSRILCWVHARSYEFIIKCMCEGKCVSVMHVGGFMCVFCELKSVTENKFHKVV